MDKKALTGWGQAFFAVLILWSISNVFLGYSIRSQGCDPIVYSCVVFTSASLVLLGYAGYGKLAKETMRSIDTWGYGFSLMLNYITLLALLSMITSTEATLLQSIAVILSLLSSWLFIGRKPSKGQAVGSIAISAGLLMVLSDLDVANLGYIILLVIAMGLIQTVRTYIAEFHRPHKYAVNQLVDVKDRARVVALVMFSVSTLFFMTFLGFALIMSFIEGVHIPSVPTLQDFLNPYTVIYGMLAGVILIAPLRYFEFSATHAIKTENYLAVSAFAPIATWAWEWGTEPITDINMRQLTEVDAMACVLITAGGVFMALSRMRRDTTPRSIKKFLYVETQDIAQVEDSREILANTLEHFKSNIKKSAEALDLPVSVIEALLNDKDKALAFKDDTLKDVARRYRRNVALSDSLTGLANRAGFMTALKGAPYETKAFSLIFIDLDKFKPINDTYGHDAGDFVLKTIAERLGKLFPKRSLITRLGGDEFCVLLLDHNKEQANAHTADIQRKICEPMEFNGNDFAVSASLGVASYPEDSTSAEELLKLADSGMYSEKKER